MTEAVSLDRLELMTSQWECEQLVRRYAYLNDHMEYEELADLFAGDGSLIRPDMPGAPVSGRQAILEFFRSRPNRLSRHFTNNIVITIDSERAARGCSYIVLYQTISALGTRGKIPRCERRIIACSHDRFVRTAEGWRFAERRLSLTMST